MAAVVIEISDRLKGIYDKYGTDWCNGNDVAETITAIKNGVVIPMPEGMTPEQEEGYKIGVAEGLKKAWRAASGLAVLRDSEVATIFGAETSPFSVPAAEATYKILKYLGKILDEADEAEDKEWGTWEERMRNG